MNKYLVVIPSDPIAAYEAKGTSSWLKDYYNPNGYFDQVYVLSPRENKEREAYGLKIIPVKSNRDYKKKLKKINPVCVRAYGGYWATDYANYNRVFGIPVVSSIHDTNPNLIHDSLKFSDKYITMSNVIKKILLENKYAEEDEVYVLGNRVDLNTFKKIDADVNINVQSIRSKFPSGKMILHIGRVSEQKNFETVIKSLKFLNPEFFIVHIGIGDFTTINPIVEKENLTSRIFHVSKVENNELAYWYNAANVVCNPSKWEGFGVVFIEAAACKSKIVTSNIAPMNEFLVNDHQMNYLVDDYENPKRISEAIYKLLDAEESNNDTLKIIREKFSKEVISNYEILQYKGIQDKKKYKSVTYFFWKFNFILNRYFNYGLKIIKIPKRVWKKINSYL
ncbi:glycosyltransferase family 4 protein [Wenyingzhuangia sp. chi5]|uniref:Glycosyltransferase family 4 protein n=1 Tax=Wenyingzhuangia gilva TaxID=3057677 RepID=A0ABT8VT20_9FLAO|nr:glycosyltransferase family 4 protein [Wenyingzhuangia sp. chi5]MDO3695120.1 glycosyltransferase family 4 protein [Wenyingzhuangia sp. chi5]